MYFALRLCYFVPTIDHYVPPDEITHLGISLIYQKSLLLPENSPETFQLGLVTNIPYLYYFLMGKLANLNVLPIHDLFFLRLINALFGILTIFFAHNWMKLLTNNRIAHTLFIIMLTNTLMFTFLCASINYDNLLNLISAMSLYYLFSFFERRNPASLMIFGVCVLAGTLTKKTFLPLAFLFMAVLFMHEKGAFLARQ